MKITESTLQTAMTLADDIKSEYNRPLSKELVTDLLTIAKVFKDNTRVFAQVQVRLSMGMPVHVGPGIIWGPDTEKQAKLEEFFVKNGSKGPTQANISRIMNLTR